MKTIPISEAQKNKMYVINKVDIENEKVKNHLNNLMIIKNEKIKILHKSYGCKAFIVSVQGINYAIEKAICDKILVYDL